MNQFKVSRISAYRTEIDGLRAIAVVAVVLGHFFTTTFKNGYLGVDVFFVVSGYVITQLQTHMNMTNVSKYLLEFYAKRIRRILPALLVVILITLILTFLLFSRSAGEMVNTGKYSILGISNLYLFHLSTDYFGVAGTSNPFTHTWSLGVEEQFYFLYPILIILATKIRKNIFLRIILISIIILSLGSIALAAQYSERNPNLAFYSMPTRIWEFGLGAIAFVVTQCALRKNYQNVVFRYLAICALLTMILLPISLGLVGQVLVCGSTALFLTGPGDDFFSRLLSKKCMTWIGLRSYSIYLIHWPTLVISNYLFGSSNLKNFIFIPIILFLSNLNFKYVEIPFRKGDFRTDSIRTVLIGIAVVALCFASLNSLAPRLSKSYNNTLPKLFGVSEVPTWTPAKCSGNENIRKLTNPLEECLGGSRNSMKAFVYLVGDSHADQLLPMVLNSFSGQFYAVKNINLENGRDFPFGDFKVNSNSESLKFLLNNAKYGDIVLLTFHRGHLNQSRDNHVSLKKEIELTATTIHLMHNLDKFSKNMEKLGVKIILMKDTPLMHSIQTSESCALQNKIIGSNGCTISRDQDLHTRYLQDIAFDYVGKRNRNVLVWDPLEYVYRNSETFNPFRTDGTYAMWDWNHITKSYALELSPSFQQAIRYFLNQS